MAAAVGPASSPDAVAATIGADGKEDDRPRKIAVIGVHGVGEHVAGATAASIVQQLQFTQGNAYPHFDETAFEIPVDTTGLGIDGGPAPPPAKRRRLAAGFGSVFLSRAYSDAGTPDFPTDIAFTKSLLEGGGNYREVYASTRWSGEKLGPDGSKAASVDVFEMYWSDLSHGGGIFAVFTQFAQLLIHLASLGRTAAAFMAAANPAWKKFYSLNAIGYWIFSMPIVIGNLWFVVLGGVFATSILQDIKGTIGTALFGAELAFAVGYGLLQWLKNHHWRSNLAALATALVGMAGALAWWIELVQFGLTPVMLLAVLPLAGAGYALTRLYEKFRPGAVRLWGIFGVVLLVAAVGIGLRSGEPGYLQSITSSNATMLKAKFSIADLRAVTSLWHVLEFLFCVIGLLWIVLAVVNLLLVLVGMFRAQKPDWSTVFTCMVAALLPAPLFLGAVLSFWTLVYYSFCSFLPPIAIAPWLHIAATGPQVAKLVSGLIDHSAGPTFVPYLVTFALGFVLILVGLLPSVLAELFPPLPAAAPLAEPLGPGPARALQAWLDAGYVSLRAGVVIIASGALVLLPIGWILGSLPIERVGVLKYLPSQQFVELFGLAFSGGAVGFLAATKLFANSFSGFFRRARVVIDTAIDVDNWLRERPEGDTLRLRAFARYHSLLRHLADRGYDDLIVVAHSQGSVITADLFRYLTVGGIGFPDGLPSVRLLTMGCPLLQLYDWRFPVVYGWAGQDGQAGADPGTLGVARWVNAYGSGDYVGRALWNGPVAGAAEFCIGAEAHTHYLDPNNLCIGDCIDGLIG